MEGGRSLYLCGDSEYGHGDVPGNIISLVADLTLNIGKYDKIEFSHIEFIDEILSNFLDVLAKNENVRHFIFNHLRLFHVDLCIKMKSVISHNCTIVVLNLSSTGIGSAGAKLLAEGLHSNQYTVIEELLLGDNNIGDIGANALSFALEDNTSITKLVLYKNNIGDIGAQSLASILKKNTDISHIDLSLNVFGHAGFEAFILVLLKNTTLLKFMCTYGIHPLTRYCIGVLSDMLKNNCIQDAQKFWYPRLHSSFNCHDKVMATLICNGCFSVKLSMAGWMYIFSFWQKNQFMD